MASLAAVLWCAIPCVFVGVTLPAAEGSSAEQAVPANQAQQLGPAMHERMEISLYQDIYELEGLSRPWSTSDGRLHNTHTDFQPRTVQISLPNGRKVESWTRRLVLVQRERRVILISLVPLLHPLPLAEANDKLDELLTRWEVPDIPELRELRRIMRLPTVSTNRYSAPLTENSHIEVETHAQLLNGQLYSLVVKVCASRDTLPPYPATAPSQAPGVRIPAAAQVGPTAADRNPALDVDEAGQQVEAFRRWEQDGGGKIDVNKLLNDPANVPTQGMERGRVERWRGGE